MRNVFSRCLKFSCNFSVNIKIIIAKGKHTKFDLLFPGNIQLCCLVTDQEVKSRGCIKTNVEGSKIGTEEKE